MSLNLRYASVCSGNAYLLPPWIQFAFSILLLDLDMALGIVLYFVPLPPEVKMAIATALPLV